MTGATAGMLSPQNIAVATGAINKEGLEGKILKETTKWGSIYLLGTDEERTAYINFLKAGSSDYPTEIMKRSGVDMTKADYLRDAFNTFEKRLNDKLSLTEECALK